MSFRVVSLRVPITCNYDKDLVSQESDQYGVYELFDYCDTLYIGYGLIRTQLLSHLPDGPDPIIEASRYRVKYMRDKETAKLWAKAMLDVYHEQKGRFPRFNKQ